MIRVQCANCGTRMRGPDDSAGKKIKCPKCGERILIPEPDLILDENMDSGDPYGLEEPVLPRMSVGPSSPQEDNLFAAPKAKKTKAKRKKRSPADDEPLSGTDMVLCLLCPGIACIASIVYMIQGKSKGIKVFGLSIVGNILWGVIRFAVENASRQQGGLP